MSKDLKPQATSKSSSDSQPSNENYSPDEIVSLALFLFGQDKFDIDPCSNSHETPNLPAHNHWTKEDNSLNRFWWGKILMNPPFSRGLINQFIDKAILEYQENRVEEIIVITKTNTSSAWASRILAVSSSCFPFQRVHYKKGSEKRTVGKLRKGSDFDSMLHYMGKNTEGFKRVFSNFGVVKQ